MSDFSSTLAAAKAGDREAMARLYEEHAGPVLGAVRKRLRQPLRRRFDTMDLAQSVFAEVLSDLPRFRDLGETAFRHWLYIKVESKVSGKLRKHLGARGQRAERRLQTSDHPAAERGSPLSEVARLEESDRIEGLVGTLREEHRRLLLLRLEGELTFAEIAQRLGLPSEDAARKRYARCLARLRRNLP